MNKFLQNIHPHTTRRISEATAHDPDIINLLVGELPYDPPRKIIDQLVMTLSSSSKSVSYTHHRYSHSRGTPSLRQAIAQRYQRLYNTAIDPDTELLITQGATEAVWLSIFTLTNPGDEVLIPDPCYMIYEPIVKALGRSPVRISTSEEAGFQIDPAKVLYVITPRTRLLIINSPENPTGAVYDHSVLADLITLANRFSFYLVHDEVYDAFTYTGKHIPALMLDTDTTRVVMVNSLSKRFGIGGWRLGWLIAAPSIIIQAVKAHNYVNMMTSTLLQEAVVEAINDYNVEQEIACRAETLQRRGDLLLEGLRNIEGLRCNSATIKSGFYAFIHTTELFQRLNMVVNSTQSIGETVAHYLLDNCKIAVVPGIGFGSAGADYIRISFAVPEDDLTTAIKRMQVILK